MSSLLSNFEISSNHSTYIMCVLWMRISPPRSPFFKVDDILIDRENASYSRLHQINDGFLTKLFFRHFRMRYAAAATGFDANSSLEKKVTYATIAIGDFPKYQKRGLPS